MFQFLSLLLETTFCTHTFFNFQVYIKKLQVYNSIGLSAHISYFSNNFRGAISENKVVFHFEGYDYDAFPDKIIA